MNIRKWTGIVLAVMLLSTVFTAAKKHIFYTGNGLDIHGTGGFHSSQITGIHDDLLTGLQVVFDNMAVKFQEYHPFSGKALHDFLALENRTVFP